MLTPQQLAERNKGIGASEIGAILGCDPYKSPRDVWLLKTGRVPPTDAGDAAHIGNVMESAILTLAAEQLGGRVVAPSSTFVRGILRANVDGMLHEFKRGQPIVEAKMTSIEEGWDAPSTVPDRVFLQIQMQMLCAGSDVAHVARLLTRYGAQFNLFTVPVDRDECERIESFANAWWQRHIVADEEPLGAVNPDLLSARSRVSGTRVALPRDLVAAERSAHFALKTAEAVHDAARSAVVCALRDAEFGDVDGGGVVSYKTVTSSRLDVAALTQAHPDLALEFKRESNSRRFTVTGMKETQSATATGSAEAIRV